MTMQILRNVGADIDQTFPEVHRWAYTCVVDSQCYLGVFTFLYVLKLLQVLHMQTCLQWFLLSYNYIPHNVHTFSVFMSCKRHIISYHITTSCCASTTSYLITSPHLINFFFKLFIINILTYLNYIFLKSQPCLLKYEDKTIF